jgi:hypothetical protein
MAAFSRKPLCETDGARGARTRPGEDGNQMPRTGTLFRFSFWVGRWGHLAVEFLTTDGHDAFGFVNLARMNRLEDLKRFYSLLDALERCNQGGHKLSDCDGRMAWPKRGVYFFREFGENRSDTGNGLRVVRVGTHAIRTGSKRILWQRLSQHRGTIRTGGGHHSGSVFRVLVGMALMTKNNFVCNSWEKPKSASTAVTKLEERREIEVSKLEVEVSKIICNMPFLWLAVEDDPGPNSLRRKIEKNSIALLSNFGKTAVDAPSANWLGSYCDSEKVRRSGLWNRDDTEKNYEAAFLDELERLIQQMQIAV